MACLQEFLAGRCAVSWLLIRTKAIRAGNDRNAAIGAAEAKLYKLAVSDGDWRPQIRTFGHVFRHPGQERQQYRPPMKQRARSEWIFLSGIGGHEGTHP
jgi:hypothetical protein